MKRTAIIICSLIIAAVIAGTALTLASPSDKKDLISSEKALSIALADAGIAAENAADVKSVLSEDDSEHFFEVEFDSGENEYDYKISAEDGSIISRKVEADKEDDVNDTSVQADNKQTASSGTESTSAFIGVDKAKSIALSDAKVKASEATFTKAKLDKDDGGYEYEIDFRSGGTEYEYSINAKTGKIIEKDVEKLSSGNKTTTTTKAQESTSAFIGVDKAKSIALSDANVKSSEATFIKAKLDKDDGVYEYEIDFRSGGTEYEYSINAKTGKIIEKDVEKLSSGNKTTTTTKAQEST
ncbi:MAG: PepSY domain-containing protein, partial [Oscillospiraceae bacterium]|nr:PepSY domain-containing protein [Oscillospiraceae bacterium]